MSFDSIKVVSKSWREESHGCGEVLQLLFLQIFPDNPFRIHYSSAVVGSRSSKASLSLVTQSYIKIALPHTHANIEAQFSPVKGKKNQAKSHSMC